MLSQSNFAVGSIGSTRVRPPSAALGNSSYRSLRVPADYSERLLHVLCEEWAQWWSLHRWQDQTLGVEHNPVFDPYIDVRDGHRQHESEGDVADRAMFAGKAEQFNDAVAQLPEQHREALRLWANMKYLNRRYAVFQTNRLDRAEIERLVTEATPMLVPLLRRQQVEI